MVRAEVDSLLVSNSAALAFLIVICTPVRPVPNRQEEAARKKNLHGDHGVHGGGKEQRVMPIEALD
jgi:hypothetical protein